jgi:histidine triad (HIT) family protein
MNVGNCVFCAIVRGEAPATVVREWDHALAIVPLNPVTPGHLLVVPWHHVADVGSEPVISGMAMLCAAQLASELPDANVITSKGSAATQTVFHLHIHVVPRVAGDGLALPWSPRGAA